MKKVTNINLGGVVFAIEDAAYETLEQYLASITAKLAHLEDCEEVVADIERAIAEKCITAKRSIRTAITVADVTAIIDELGHAEAIAAVDEPATQHKQGAHTATVRKLYRDVEDAILGGVASGIGAYLGVDPLIVRILFVISVFFGGFGIVLYVLLWLIIPPAETALQKSALHGTPTTLSQIIERIRTKHH